MKGSPLGPGGFGALVFLLAKTLRRKKATRGTITDRELGVERASFRLAIARSKAPSRLGEDNVIDQRTLGIQDNFV
jgi:hypothetical protein